MIYNNKQLYRDYRNLFAFTALNEGIIANDIGLHTEKPINTGVAPASFRLSVTRLAHKFWFSFGYTAEDKYHPAFELTGMPTTHNSVSVIELHAVQVAGKSYSNICQGWRKSADMANIMAVKIKEARALSDRIFRTREANMPSPDALRSLELQQSQLDSMQTALKDFDIIAKGLSDSNILTFPLARSSRYAGPLRQEPARLITFPANG